MAIPADPRFEITNQQSDQASRLPRKRRAAVWIAGGAQCAEREDVPGGWGAEVRIQVYFRYQAVIKTI